MTLNVNKLAKPHAKTCILRECSQNKWETEHLVSRVWLWTQIQMSALTHSGSRYHTRGSGYDMLKAQIKLAH